MSENKLHSNLIIELIERIENSIRDISNEEFIENIDVVDATLMRLQAIGESIKKISLDAKKEIKEINWKKFERLRNIISHKYALINRGLIWNIINEEIPNLKLAILKIKWKIKF